MIASLSGTVGGRLEGSLIVDVGGVGYLVGASLRTLSAVGESGSPVALKVLTQVREDSITLFGFVDDDERDVFRMLLSVQGVGPKVAMAVLSCLDPASVAAAIATEDRQGLCKADGVGPKLAARIVIELKDKAASMSLALRASAGVAAGLKRDAGEAIIRLGYSKSETAGLVAAVFDAPSPPSTLPAAIAAMLRAAAPQRG